MRTSIYLAVTFAILFISLSEAAVYNRQPGNGTPSGSGLARPGSSGMKTRSNILQRRSVHHHREGGVVNGATQADNSGAVSGAFGGGGGGISGDAVNGVLGGGVSGILGGGAGGILGGGGGGGGGGGILVGGL